jgi:regulator of cell morphogenesis and NO signaling
MSSTVEQTEVLDCDLLSARTPAETTLETFDALAPGHCVRLVSGHPLEEALASLQRGRRGAFEWSPLREGPESWEVEVERRAAPVGSARQVTEALVWDHTRLDALEAAAFEARARGALGTARGLFADFAHGLRRHIGFEEQILFPEFDARCRLEGGNGPTAVMRAEHRSIIAILQIMERQIGDPASPIELSRVELREIQRDHDLKEERILYPALDRLLADEESDQVVARIQRWTRN